MKMWRYRIDSDSHRSRRYLHFTTGQKIPLTNRQTFFMTLTYLVPLLLLLSLGAAPGLAHGADMACFKNVHSYMLKRFGADYKLDENLIVEQRKYGSQIFTDVTDVTAGTNRETTLLRPFPRRGSCVVLKSFPLIGIDVAKTDKAGRPIEIVGQDQGMTSNEIRYTLTRSGTYEATRCLRHMYNESGGAPLVAEVPCRWVLGEHN